ncbi:MAG: adenylate/guanylate cyclase domain-containing protein [Alphaproteobacteria bacterium]
MATNENEESGVKNSGLAGPGKPGIASRWNGRISITITLASAIGLLVLVSVGTVLGVGVWLAQKNTVALLSANAGQSIDAAVNRVKQHLRPAEYQARFISQRIARGEIDPKDRKAFGRMLVGALAAAPQIEAIIYIGLDLRAFSAGREPKTGRVGVAKIDYTSDPIIRKNMARIRHGSFWGPPIWRQQTKKTYLNLAYPVKRGGKLVGAVVAAVPVRELSGFVGGMALRDVGRVFILYGREHVLAHSLMVGGIPGRDAKNPLPALNGFGDPVLGSIWQTEDRYKLNLDLRRGTKGHVLNIYDNQYIYIYQEVSGFGPRPLLVGAYFQTADVGKEMRRMLVSLIVGIVALVLSLLAAVFLGRHIARPIVRFSASASRIRDLEIAQIEDLPGSVFRELNDQSAAFNAMLRALRWFELYVPRKIVASLVRRGGAGEVISDDREITVLFTDIVGFSTASEGMEAPEVAAFLNRHFAIIAGCIEAEDGTVDKFIGDAVMAFWGAPEAQADSARRACRAALAIADAIRAENIQRAASGQPPVGIRIGVHTGTATVGNIGSPDRLNYTIIGDTVNIGERLEQLGKEVYPAGADVAIVISEDTRRALGKGFKTTAAGRFKLKGRAGETKVFKLG